MHRLTHSELRIIEQTKREGEKLERQEQSSPASRRRTRIWSLVAFILIFFLLAFGVKLLIGFVS